MYGKSSMADVDMGYRSALGTLQKACARADIVHAGIRWFNNQISNSGKSRYVGKQALALLAQPSQTIA